MKLENLFACPPWTNDTCAVARPRPFLPPETAIAGMIFTGKGPAKAKIEVSPGDLLMYILFSFYLSLPASVVGVIRNPN